MRSGDRLESDPSASESTAWEKAVYYDWKARAGFGSYRGRTHPGDDRGCVLLVFFVLVGLVHGEATEFVGDFQQVLVALIPFGTHLTQEHRPLVGPS